MGEDMKRLFMTSYEYREGLGEQERREMTAVFAEYGAGEGAIAQYERLDGTGGFLVSEEPPDLERDFEGTLRFSRWMHLTITPVVTMDEAFPVYQRVFG
jgi:hypothetical protein